MPAETVAEMAVAASRIKVFFATWLPSSYLGATQAKSAKVRYIRVGFEDQIPRRLSSINEFFNADVFFTSGPLQQQFLKAYEQQDNDVLQLLFMISLFSQGPGYWQFGSLKPKLDKSGVPKEAKVLAEGENLLFWSGLDTAVWKMIANLASKLEALSAEALREIILNEIGHVQN